MIFQHFNLLKTATVYDNIAIPLKLFGYNKQEVDEKVQKYAEIVGLSDKLTSYPKPIIWWAKTTCRYRSCSITRT